MPDPIAEAFVAVRPDLSGFQAALRAELAAATAGVQVPALAIGAGATGATAATAGLVGAQEAAATAALGLATAEEAANTALAQGAVILPELTAETLTLAGAQAEQALAAQAAATAQTKSAAATAGSTAAILGAASATGRLDAALLGLRTALGSTAVIGLSAAALAAIALGKALRASSDLAADFETQMNVLAATTGASAEQVNQAAAAARQLGEDASLPAVSAGDAAQAITELSKAGLDLQSSITGARGVLELATAASIDNAQATELAANALNAFGLAAEETTHVADLLANASIAAQGSIADIGVALQQSAAAAAQVGVSLDDTVALLTLLAQGGLRASDAGTSLRVALLRLAAPTREAAAILKELNIQVRDAQGNIRPEVFSEFAQATARLSPALRDAAAAAVFGQDAFRAFSLISREGTAGLAETRSELERQGAAAELASARTQGFAGALGALQSSAETFGASFGQLINKTLLPAVEAFTGIATGANKAAAAITAFGNVSIPVLGRVGDIFNDLFKVIGPLAVFRLPVQGIQQFSNLVQGAGTVTDQLSEKLDNARTALDLALATGRTDQVALLSRQIGALERALDSLAGQAGKSLGQGILSTSDVETARASASLRSRFDEIGDSVSRTAEQAGEQIGTALNRGVARALTASQIDIINNAKQNLLRLGSDLADQVGQLIDAGPVGQQITRLQDALAARRQTTQRLGLVQDLEDARNQLQLALIDAGPLADKLRELQATLDRLRQTDTRAGLTADLKQAQADLAEARSTITGVGDVSPQERQAIQRFLAPFLENVRAKKAALQQANIEATIDKVNKKITQLKAPFTEDDVTTARRRIAAIQQTIKDFDQAAVIAGLQQTLAAQKKAVADGIANLITQFNEGAINLAQFNQRLARLIQSRVGPFQTAGTVLGQAFAAAFIAQVEATVEQAKQIALAPQAPGVGVAPAVVNINQELKDLEQKQLNAQNKTNTLLEEIKERLRPPTAAATKGARGSPR